MAGSSGENQEPLNSYKVVIQSEAEAEILNAYRYYEDKAEGLGMDFVRAVDACLSSIQRQPKIYAVVHKEVRRALLRRFPYGIFYLIEEDSIIVIACFHARRDPKQWQQRV